MKPAEEAQRSPLAGVRVVNTRGPRQARELDTLLHERLAVPLPYPCIDIVPPLDPGPLDAALRRAAEGAFDWLAFTSANAVEAVETRLEHLGIAATQLAGARIAAVGPGTAAALSERLGLDTDLCPEEHQAEVLAVQLATAHAQRVLVPQAERAREALASILAESRVRVETVTAYRTVLGSGGVDVPRLAHEGGVDAVAFASPSAVDNMATRFEQENGEWDDVRRACIACIGPVTTAAAQRRGLFVSVMAQEQTILGLVDGLERYYRENRVSGD